MINYGNLAGQMPQNRQHRCNLNLEEHLKYIDALVSGGIIDENTGKSIKQNMTATFALKTGVSTPEGGQNPVNFDESEFLKARACLLDYLKGHNLNLDAADMKEIEEIVLALEAAAIEKEGISGANNTEKAIKLLNESNEIAKGRLISASLAGQGTKSLPEKTFTRDEIARMSTAEFIKNEPIINYQLQNGLI